MKKIILKNALLGGIIVCIIMISMTIYMKSYPNNQPNAIVGFVSMLLAFTFVIIGIKQYREANDNRITFGKAFLIGFSISLIMSILYVIVWLIIYYNFFPNFMDHYSEMVIKNTKPDEIAAKTSEMNQMKEWYKNPIMVILLTLMEIFPLGLVISFFAALVLKRTTKN